MAAPWWVWMIGGAFWCAVVLACWPRDLLGRLRPGDREPPDDHFYP